MFYNDLTGYLGVASTFCRHIGCRTYLGWDKVYKRLVFALVYHKRAGAKALTGQHRFDNNFVAVQLQFAQNFIVSNPLPALGKLVLLAQIGDTLSGWIV